MEKVRNGRAKSSYLPPRMEIYRAESCRPLASSPLSGGHDDGDDDGIITGAKGGDISFSDLWESSWEDEISWEDDW